MSLQKSHAAFTKSLAGAADKLPARPKPPPPPAQPTPAATPTPGTPKRKRVVQQSRPTAPSIVYSQPTDTALMGQHILTQVHHAVQYLKEKERPLTPDDVAGYLSIQMTPALLDILKRNERITYNAANNTFAFRPKHNIRSATALVGYLQQLPTAQGLLVKELKDGWAGALEAVDQLEADGEILVTRTKKDNQARMVWGNDKTLDVDVDDEFKAIWHRILIPPNEELPGQLEALGLKPTSEDPSKLKKEVKKDSKRKRANNRRAKVSNTHMSGILKDSKDLRRA